MQHVCQLCGYESETFEGYAAHFKKVHIPQKANYKCKLCGYKTKTYDDIYSHVLKVHPEKHLSEILGGLPGTRRIRELPEKGKEGKPRKGRAASYGK